MSDECVCVFSDPFVEGAAALLLLADEDHAASTHFLLLLRLPQFHLQQQKHLSVMMSFWRAAVTGAFPDCVCVIGRTEEYVNHLHLHFHTALIRHTDTPTGARDDGGRWRNTAVQRHTADTHAHKRTHANIHAHTSTDNSSTNKHQKNS